MYFCSALKKKKKSKLLMKITYSKRTINYFWYVFLFCCSLFMSAFVFLIHWNCMFWVKFMLQWYRGLIIICHSRKKIWMHTHLSTSLKLFSLKKKISQGKIQMKFLTTDVKPHKRPKLQNAIPLKVKESSTQKNIASKFHCLL